MISLAISQLRASWRRSLAVFLSVALGVAFVTSALLVGQLSDHSMIEAVGKQSLGADLVVLPETGTITPDLVDLVAAHPDVRQTDGRSVAAGMVSIGSTQTSLLIGTPPTIPAVKEHMHLRSGKWPSLPNEIVLSESQMNDGGLTLGDSITWTSWETDDPSVFRIVGVSPNASGIGMSLMDGFVTPETLAALAPGEAPLAVLVELQNGVSDGQVAADLQAQLGDGFSVRTYAEYSDWAVETYSGGSAALQIVTLGFALISMFAAAIVIANSFEISVAQRVREIGLLRTVGATSTQVRRMVLFEGGGTGIVASIIGMGIGYGVIEAASRMLFTPAASITLTLPAVIAPFLLGVLVTVIAALGAARTAMRVVPLQALRQSEAPIEDVQTHRRRRIISLLMISMGFVLLAGAVALAFNIGVANGIPMAIGILGGGVSFLGVLISASIFVPAILMRVQKMMGDRFGISGELALSNVNRNPRRTATSSAALLLGVTLITMMVVGVSISRATIVNVVNQERAIDISIIAHDGDGNSVEVPSSELTRWSNLDGVNALVVAFSTTVSTTSEQNLTLTGVDFTEGNDVLRTDTLRDRSQDILVIHPARAEELGVADGDTIDLISATGHVTCVVVVDKSVDQAAVVSTSTIAELDPTAPASGAWIRLDDSATVGDVMRGIREYNAFGTTLEFTGGASSRAELMDVLDTLLLIALALLAVSVVISVVGIGNTLMLSVIERTRETGVLRSIGLKRGQSWRMLAIEGVTLSLTGCVIGLALGIVYGIAGAFSIFGDTFTVELQMPWLWFVAIVLGAVVCGVISSLMPARRLLRIHPVEALAEIG